MRKTFKKLFAVCLIISLCMSLNATAFASSFDPIGVYSTTGSNYLGNVVFTSNGASQLPSSGSKDTTLSGSPTEIGYIIILANPSRSGSVNVTFTNTNLPQYTVTKTLIADGTYHTANISGMGLGFLSNVVTTSYKNPTVPLLSISISFVN